MKKVLYLLFVLLGVSLFFFSCSLSVAPSQTDIDNAVAKADTQSQKVVDLLADNDEKGLNDYLAAVDPEGAVASLIDAHKVTRSAVAPEVGTSVAEIPDFSDPDSYNNGDVLVFQGDGSSWQAQLMSLVLVGTFGHAGVLDQGLAIANTNNACVLSATTAQDENGNWINGLCMQDQSELMATCLTLGRFSVSDVSPEAIPTALSSTENWMASAPSLYSFLHLNLEPVSRDDNLLWYCSKVPWRFYNDNFDKNIEEAGFYFGNDDKWKAMRSTTLYQIYYAFLLKILPSRWSSWAGILADEKLKRVLNELITPDELWYRSGNVDKVTYGYPLTDVWTTRPQ